MESRNNTSNTGSAVLLLIGLLFFLTIITGVIVRMTVYGADIVGCRGKTIEHAYATEGMLLYAVTWLNQHAHEWKTGSERMVYQGPWFEQRNSNWRGTVTLSAKKSSGILHAQLFDKKVMIAEQFAQVVVVNNVMHIVAWNR